MGDEYIFAVDNNHLRKTSEQRRTPRSIAPEILLEMNTYTSSSKFSILVECSILGYTNHIILNFKSIIINTKSDNDTEKLSKF